MLEKLDNSSIVHLNALHKERFISFKISNYELRYNCVWDWSISIQTRL